MKTIFEVVWETAVAGDVVAMGLVGFVCMVVMIAGLGMWDVVQEGRQRREQRRWVKMREKRLLELAEERRRLRVTQMERDMLEGALARRERLEWRDLNRRDAMN